jgi:hypothetical protein
MQETREKRCRMGVFFEIDVCLYEGISWSAEGRTTHDSASPSSVGRNDGKNAEQMVGKRELRRITLTRDTVS